MRDDTCNQTNRANNQGKAGLGEVGLSLEELVRRGTWDILLLDFIIDALGEPPYPVILHPPGVPLPLVEPMADTCRADYYRSLNHNGISESHLLLV